MMASKMMFMVNKDGVAEVYNDTYDVTIHCRSEEEQNRCINILKRNLWIPVEEQLPETDDYILLSFEDYSTPLVGCYEKDSEGGGKFYVGDDMESCISADLYVNAWMPLPEPYRNKD